MTLLLTLVFAAGSALIPLLNVEAYLLALAAVGGETWWLLALAAAAGQTAGKLVLFAVARGSLRADWLRRQHPADGRMHRWVGRVRRRPHADESRVRRWTARVQRQRHGVAILVAASAVIGIPPLLVVSALAGTTTMRPAVFAATCLSGRWLRFSLLLAAPALLL